jgi:hypothetical protein
MILDGVINKSVISGSMSFSESALIQVFSNYDKSEFKHGEK